jgi:hypothetical protein
MFKATVLILSVLVAANATELPSKKYLNLSAIKTMVAAAEAEAEAQRHNVQVTICVVDESGNLLFLEKRLLSMGRFWVESRPAERNRRLMKRLRRQGSTHYSRSSGPVLTISKVS